MLFASRNKLKTGSADCGHSLRCSFYCLSPNKHRGTSDDYRATMCSAVAHSCSGLAAYHYGGRTFYYCIRWSYADVHVTYDGCR